MAGSAISMLIYVDVCQNIPMTQDTDTTTQMDAIVTIFKAIADESRLSILAHLSSGPASVTDLAELTRRKPPSVSPHLSVLARGGLGAAERRGPTRISISSS